MACSAGTRSKAGQANATTCPADCLQALGSRLFETAACETFHTWRLSAAFLRGCLQELGSRLCRAAPLESLQNRHLCAACLTGCLHPICSRRMAYDDMPCNDPWTGQAPDQPLTKDGLFKATNSQPAGGMHGQIALLTAFALCTVRKRGGAHCSSCAASQSADSPLTSRALQTSLLAPCAPPRPLGKTCSCWGLTDTADSNRWRNA